MQVIQLHEYRGKPAAELIARLCEASKGSEPAIILDDGDVVGTLLSPDLSKEVLAERLFQSLDRTPDQVNSILERLDEDIVE